MLPLATKQTQFEMGRSLRELQDMNIRRKVQNVFDCLSAIMG
jgi:hypothetical protein